jgi:hypothetical protein
VGDTGRHQDKTSQRWPTAPYGLVTRQQLLKHGFNPRAITRRIGNGQLIGVHAGVYAVGLRRTDPPARAAAAVLACGPDALLSHAWAACLWGIRRDWPGLPEVTVPGDRRPQGVKVHRSTTLTRADQRIHLGIRVTSPARTLVENGAELTDQQLRRAVNDLQMKGWLKLSQLNEAVERLGGSRLRAFVARPTGPTRSEFEDAFLAFIAEFGLPTPIMNARVHGRERDAVFPRHKLIVELDGWQFHGDRHAFQDDRERDAEALRYGWATLRLTWDRLLDAPRREAERFQRIWSSVGSLVLWTSSRTLTPFSRVAGLISVGKPTGRYVTP